jgi:hypothetical protein
MKYWKHLFIACFFSWITPAVKADEGMWLPLLLQQLNEKQMRSLGMKITAKDIYNINGGSLKDAIVSFGGFCTGEIISSQGLVVTNHHCGFDAIQNHSTLEHNYIQDGFWSRSYAEELPNDKLFVTFIIRIEDVSKQVLAGITDKMSEPQRQAQVDKNIADIRKNTLKESYQESFVRSFFEGNQYFLFVTETYKDVRLVGAPPASIGNFGKDSDNWMWPRHTGDFSMFRIYAGKDNKPAEYSPENVPYVPKKSLSISLDGMNEGDFTMIFGFPGRTTEYLHSAAVDQIVKVNDPAKIVIREKALSVISGFMRKDEQIRIMYAEKYANIENAYKKWQGEVLGLRSTGAVEKKIAYEKEFQKRVEANPVWKEKYGSLLKELGGLYGDLEPYGYARDYFTEIISKIELFTIAAQLNSLVTAYERDGEKGFQQRLPIVKGTLTDLYGEYSAKVDQQLFETLIQLYAKDQKTEYVSPMFRESLERSGNNYHELANSLYADTKFDSKEALSMLTKGSPELIADLKTSTLIKLYTDLLKTYQQQVQGRLNEIQNNINQLQRTYMQAQMEVFKEKTFYPDANSTLRVAFGQVKGYHPRDAVGYDYYTYLDGVMEKYKPGDYEFDVPEKLRTLYRNKDFGVYGKNGKMPVCFIASNHTTGGNSGSPVLDAYGNLMGLNFDRVWEGTMSDINYDPSLCRNIMVDIRYVLFIVDKFAGASRLISEMKLVHPKSGK